MTTSTTTTATSATTESVSFICLRFILPVPTGLLLRMVKLFFSGICLIALLDSKVHCDVSGRAGRQMQMGRPPSWNKSPVEGRSQFYPWTTKRIVQEVRGGGECSAPTSNVTIVEEYIANVEEKDAQQLQRVQSPTNRKNQKNQSHGNKKQRIRNYINSKNKNGEEHTNDDNHSSNTNDDGDKSMDASDNTSDTTDVPPNNKKGAADEASNPAVGVGVKSQHHKKSNAVGDPDGDDSDDNSDEESSADWEDLEEELEDLDLLMDPATQLQVEVELVEDDMGGKEEEEQTDGNLDAKSSSGGGGVGVQRPNRRNSRIRQNSKADWRSSTTSSTGAALKSITSLDQEQLLDAWKMHVYFPPSSAALAYLVKNARFLDAASKTRLDRRTLYACLMLEWLHQSASNRKFLDSTTAQSLQSSLSLATQPKWRQTFPRPSAIRLFENEVGKSCTLGMQETITMALVSIEKNIVNLKPHHLLSITIVHGVAHLDFFSLTSHIYSGAFTWSCNGNCG